MQQPTALQRIIQVYFDDPAKTLAVKSGTQVLRQEGYNDRLYWVKSGKLAGFMHDEKGEQTARIFRAEPGMFFGVHSFFSRTLVASTTVIAEEDSELAWIDSSTGAVDAAQYGSLSEQFMPVMVHELAKRQVLAGQQAIAKEKALQKLYAAEQMTTLGQLAAGIAHELNNAIGVLSSKTDGMQGTVRQYLARHQPELSPFLADGLDQGQAATSSQVRQRARALQQQYALAREPARQLARAVPDGEVPAAWLADLDESLAAWELGRDLHDMRLAAQHASSIVRSVKQLGGGDQARQPGVDINDTLHKSLSLLQSNLRRVSVVLRPAALPLLTASSTELVQVWVNIIKNACDAMAETRAPQLEIITRCSRRRVTVLISNNGPMIDEAIRHKVFHPNFTTKKGGLSFGLGLGLSIVQRIVHSYGGSISLKSEPDMTQFRIHLPIA